MVGGAPAVTDGLEGPSGVHSESDDKGPVWRRLVFSPRLVGAVAIAVALVIHIPSLGQPLLEAHSFRQTQTAFTALIYHENGIDLLHPKLPILGAPWEIPFEFPLFQALASLVMDAGVSPDVAMRVTALAAFALTAFLTWRLTVRLAGEVAGLFALAAFLFSPLAMLWSRASLVEYLATAAGVGYVMFALRWYEGQGRWWYVAAMGAGVAAILVKITTGILYVLPVMAVPLAFGLLRRGPWRPLAPYVVAMALLVAVPLGLGLLWTRHTDAIKSASAFTASLTSEGLSTWNFGTLAQKLSLPDWHAFTDAWSRLLYGAAIWVWTPLALIGAAASRHRAVALALVASAWVGPIVFTNLYFAHDYYLVAITPLVAIGIGLAARWLWDRRRWRAAQVMGAVLAILWVAETVSSRGYWMVQYQGVVDVEDALVAAQEIAANSEPSEPVVVTGRDWSPAALYYARRWGLMFIGSPLISLSTALAPEMVQQLQSLGYQKVFHCPWKSPDGCTRIIDLDEVPEDLGTDGVSAAVPPYIVGRPMGTGGGCNMETLNGRPWANEVLEVGSAATIEITGWAFDDERKALARAIHVVLRDANGTDHYATTSRVDRPDVGDYFGDPELAGAGYVAGFSSESLPRGEYDAMVVMDTEGGPVLCAAGRRLRL
jgi:hypothetical protein